MNRRGSALLVVLGMLSFMVISAVAFSAYMRHSRLPSSYLRRASSSRHLAKAALAEAIDMIDAMIGNDRYPGQGSAGGSYRWPRHDGQSRQRNYWTERCFIGTNQLVSVDETVSTLTLEGLAYLPPAIINEARYYSRRSAAAAWHTFGFDSGRFAFSAFDVSDCLDISKLLADHGTGDLSSGRNSSDRGRIKLAYAFENANHNGFQVDPEDWDEFMEKFRDKDGNADKTKVPLTSLADFNLALHRDGPSALISPFCRFIENGTAFVQQETGTEAELQRHMLFTADSWYPQTNRTSGIDLTSERHQPLYGLGTDTGTKNEANFDQVAQNNNTFMSTYSSRITPATMAQLHDYLDRDSIPISLALPTAERTPMITGFSLQGQLMTSVVQEPVEYFTPERDEGGTKTRWKVTPYTAKVLGNNLTVMAGAVYPFKYKRGSAKSFKIQAFMSFTLVANGFDNLRPCGGSDGISGVSVPVWDTGSDSTPQVFQYASSNNRPSGFWVRSSEQSLTIPSDVREEEDALISDVKLDLGTLDQSLASELSENAANGIHADNCTMRVLQKQIQVMNPATGQKDWVDDTTTQPSFEFGALPSGDDLKSCPNQFTANVKYQPSVQVWVRILDSDKNTVDLVPACVGDDKAQSSFIAQASGSTMRPALRFACAQPADVTFDGSALTASGTQSAFSPQAYITDDPRFNYAPENFAAFSSLDGKICNMWKNKQRSKDRDGDIFMTTSDAGYLQSPYELANILRFSGLTGGSGWGLIQSGEHGGYNGKARNGFEDLAAESAMWRTFSQYDVNGDWDDIAGLDMRTGSRGFRMSPYAASKETMMSVFANTPLDWWAASTNDVQDAYGSAKVSMLDSLTEAMKYTYSKHSGAQVQIEWDDMQSVAEYVRGVFRGETNKSWEDVWDDLAWDYSHSDESSQEKLFGIDLKEPLHSVDRKFLHGYWRECFANRQQLFLIFVRAEPMMMGGGAVGQTPPQLGARAVALVWRDPNPTRADNDGEPRPHQTRVLFYRQFD